MKIFVGCSSMEHLPKLFLEHALEASKLLRNHEVILGGTKEGMMKIVSKEIPENHLRQIVLKNYAKGQENTECFQICDTSFKRLELIWKSSDVILILPGGTGSLGEMLAFLEENRTSKEKKPIIVLNDQHYYNEIVSFLQKGKQLGFCKEESLEKLTFVESLEELQKKLLEIEEKENGK